MLTIPRRYPRPFACTLQLAVAFSVLLGARSAHAHISVDQGGTHMSRYSDDGLKKSPCGMTGGTRGTHIYKYKPGATVNVSLVETIPHPGYFRISFDQDGDDGFKIPSGTDGTNGDCAGDTKCGPGKADYCNSDTVLIDNLEPHAAGQLLATHKYTFSVTFPNVECDNCTLQIIQVMNDLNFHTDPYPTDDIYYQCIDIVLSKDAPDVTDTPVKNNGMACKGASSSAAGAAGSASAGGTTGAAGAAGSMAAAAGMIANVGGMGGTATGTAGASGATMAPVAGAASAAGASAPTTTTSGGGGKGAAGSGTGTVTGTTSTAGSSSSSPTTGTAGTSTTSPASSPSSSSDGGGCQVGAGSAGGLLGPAILGLLSLGLLRRRRRAH